MSKELEALERISNCPMWKGSYYKQFTASDVEFDKDIEIVRQSLTPPTSDDVCKMIEKSCKIDKVIYERYSFIDERDDEIIVSRFKYDGKWEIDLHDFIFAVDELKAIVKFYEAQE
jgi:hypothetical protein